jgi:predicted unusual protein kinase regulating ubiquinone biosynthesis (AarF/ABC1/UbiB family)
LQKIGEDLFAIAIDQPFRFPATFTFVLRAFSTLEGIGKTLNPAYNFSEVATPYAQELLQLQDVGQQGFIIEQLQQQATEVRGKMILNYNLCADFRAVAFPTYFIYA